MTDTFLPLVAGGAVSGAAGLVFGAVAGSFLNVVADRLPSCLADGKPVLAGLCGRSFCPGCGRILSPGELVPLFSYLFLRGRCRHCFRAIGFRTFAVELLCSLFFGAVFYRYGLSFFAVCALWFGCVLLCLSVTDANTFLLPDALVFPLLFSGIFFQASRSLFSVRAALLSMASLYVLFLAASAVTGRLLRTSEPVMGAGDAKLAAAAGTWCPFPYAVWFLLVSCVSALAFVCLSKAIGRNGKVIAFGPFLCAGAFAVFWLQRML